MFVGSLFALCIFVASRECPGKLIKFYVIAQYTVTKHSCKTQLQNTGYVGENIHKCHYKGIRLML